MTCHTKYFVFRCEIGVFKGKNMSLVKNNEYLTQIMANLGLWVKHF